MKGLKKVLGFVTASALFVTALPVSSMDMTVFADTAVTADKTIRLQPGDASAFHDTDEDGFGEFEGWGTSLCWWANRIGYNAKLTDEAANAFFGDNGLEMNIGRYNVGGGDNVGTEDDGSEYWHKAHIVRSDSAVPGYATDVTKIDTSKKTIEEYKSEFTRVDEECGYAWNYDWNADKNQMNVLIAAAKASGEDFIAEAFSNSPPYFMTESGCSSGNTNSSVDNLRKDSYNAFAAYMSDVIVHWAKEGVIDFQSTTPMNEPDTNYWGANSNKQEGCHFDPGRSQSEIIVAFAKELRAQIAASDNDNVKALENIIFSASDETSIDSAITNYGSLSNAAKNVVTRIDTHTYSGSKREELRKTAEAAGENLWMSEVDGAYTAGTDAGEMTAALGLAQRIMTDLKGLKSSAWILWNAIDMHSDSTTKTTLWSNSNNDFASMDDLYAAVNLNAGYWGIAYADHDNSKIAYTKKYDAFGQFSKYIKPGYAIIGSDGNTLAAYDPNEGKVVIVAINTDKTDQTWKFDLKSFATVGTNVTANRTSGKADKADYTTRTTTDGERWADVAASDDIKVNTTGKYFTATVKANSITTYTIDGITYDASTDDYGYDDAFLKEISLDGAAVTGSTPWNNSKVNTPDKVIDGNYSTFFDGVSNGWLTIDLGETKDIVAVGYAPRSGFGGRCVNASFYGSTDNTTWTKLYTITNTPSAGSITVAALDDLAGSYRYIKYAVPEGDSSANCNIAEIKLYGTMSGISEKIAYYKGLTDGKTYSEKTKAAFDAAMAAAQALVDDHTTDRVKLRDAAYALEDAYNALVEIGAKSSFSGVDGAVMYDTEGNVIQAHGGQIQQITYDYDYNGNGTFDDDEHTFWYWVGEDKTNDYRPCPGIRGYISKDLYNWKDMGNILKTATDWDEFTTDSYFTELYGSAGVSKEEAKESGLWDIYADIWKGEYSDEGCVIERPKMLYNDKTKKYVIWFHADGQTPESTGGNYAKAKAGVAVSDSPFGPFKLQGSYLLNSNENADHGFDSEGGHVRDMNLFKDEDGTAYVLYSSDGNQTMHIAKLNDEYTNVVKKQGEAVEGVDFSRNFIDESREAPAMFKYNGKYYLMTSGCTGWYPNQASYAVADSPLGPFTTVGDPCTDTGSGTTYDTQSTCIFPVDAAKGKFIYMGDRWSNPDTGNALRDSRYVWLPIEFLPDHQMAIRRYTDWTLDDLKNKEAFSVETELPTVVTSAEEVEEKMPQKLDITLASGTKETVDVTWDGIPTGDRTLGMVTLTGTMSNGRVVTHKVNVVDAKTIYFFDCAATEDADYLTILKQQLGNTLRNTAADQQYTSANKAGYTGTLDTDFGIKTAGSDIWAHGYWAKSGKNITYAFKLEAGTYTIATGYQEWWSASRGIQVAVTDTKDNTLASESFTLASSDTSLQKNVTFTIDEKDVVTVTVSKTGSADPVLSWIAVMQDEKGASIEDRLLAAVAEGEALNKDLYTAKSYSIYASVLASAKELLAQDDITEADVNRMLKNLNDAKTVLELKKADTNTNPSTPDNSSNAGNNNSNNNTTVTPQTKSEPVIICDEEYDVTYGDKSFHLGAEVAAGNGTLTYSSSDDKVVSVAADGTVTINGVGICTITVTLAESTDYTAVSVPVTITVNPKTVSVKRVKALSGRKLKVQWKKDTSVTGYEVQCALNKTFKSGRKTVKVTKAGTTSATMKKLKKGKKYNVRVRAYKVVRVNGKSQKLYGEWSKVKTSSKVK